MESDQSLSIHLCQSVPNCNGVKVVETHDSMEEYTCRLKGIKVGSISRCYHKNTELDSRK